MNRIRLIFLLFLALFVGLISLLTLTYFEHEKIAKYGGVARELGHEVLEMRDQITSNAIAGISNPYQLSAFSKPGELRKRTAETQKELSQYQHPLLFI